MKEYYIQLPKFRKSNPDMNNKLNQWLALIDGEDRGKIEMAKQKNEVIKEAEKRRNIEIIKEMRKKDCSTELIIEITKLTKEEIEELER